MDSQHMVSFDTFNLPEPVLRALADMGFTDASPIQEASIPLLLEGRDIMAQAQTGTGKTAAFGIPLVIAAIEGRPSLVLAPTRELAQQVAGEIDRIGLHANIRALAIYGGASFGEQARELDTGKYDIIVATPGRLGDHIERGTIKPSVAKLVVLDEADEMLKMGFIDDVEKILGAVGRERQTLLFSATLPDGVRRLAEQHLRNPERIVAVADNDSVATSNTEQLAVAVEHRDKADALVRLLTVEAPTGVLVFRHTRESVDELVQTLRAKGLRADALHGGMSQDGREQVLERLREGGGRIVVATNVAARGLDVDCISHVVNFDAPREADSYVHRIGRTGRAGREGRSFLFVTPGDRGRLRHIERTLGSRLAWREIPTDAEVHAALRARTVAWLQARSIEHAPDALALIDDAIAKGADARVLAAALLARCAVREGLVPPKLEPMRSRRPQQPAPYPTRAHAAPVARHGPRSNEMIALMLSVGRDDMVRPADIVGALANEGGVPGVEIGRIDILPRMSVAEVPADRIDDLLAAMEQATIRGRSVQLRIARDWTFRTPARR